jgi:cellobiose-specific phosphotransferase system component IIC
MNNFLFQIPAIIIAAILFVLMLGINYAGYYLRTMKDPDRASDGLGPVEGSLLGLLALLLSFTFSMSAGKSDDRRQVIVQEANDIGTAILRCDLYPDSTRRALKADFAAYLEARINYYNAGIDETALNKTLRDAGTISARIWKRVMLLSQDKDNTLRSQQMIPALNDMMDITTTRDSDRNAHVPESILWMLFLLTLAGSFVTGYSAKDKRFNLIVVLSFAVMTSLTIYLILDLDRPRRGIINMDQTHNKIVELRELVKE